jgi:hypothetical protein
MAKISNTSAYPNISNLDAADYLILTDAENSLLTKSCTIGTLQSFIASGGITLTTAGSSGSSTLIDGVLNIPEYTAGDVNSVNSQTGSVVITASGGLTITETGTSTINISGTGAGNFVSLSVNGNSSAATLISGVLNIPQYQRAITVSTGGTGASSLIGANLNIPYDPVTLSTNGNSGLASLTGTVLNIPQYQRAITVSTNNFGAATLTGANLNIPYNPISLTTNGTTGDATLTNGTNILNIPVYQSNLTLATGTTSGAASISGGTLTIPNYGNNAGGPLIAVFKLSISGTTLSGSAFVNNFGGSWTFTRSVAGDYVATNSSASMTEGYVMCLVNNPNVTVSPNGAGGGSYPEQTSAERKTSTEIKIINYDLSTSGVGVKKDFGTSDVWVEVRSYPL